MDVTDNGANGTRAVSGGSNPPAECDRRPGDMRTLILPHRFSSSHHLSVLNVAATGRQSTTTVGVSAYQKYDREGQGITSRMG